MLRFKWPEDVRTAQLRTCEQRARDVFESFDFDSLITKGWLRRTLSRFVFRTLIPIVFAVLRLFVPVLKIGRLTVLSRYDDVQRVLSDSSGMFEVVYGAEMKELGDGTNFVLGLDGEEHVRHRNMIGMDMIDPVDVATVRRVTRESAEALLDAGSGELDVVRDLITRTASEATARLLGVSPQDPDSFAEWTMAVSMLLFADPLGDANVRKQALIAGEYIRSLIDDEIDRARRNQRFFDPGTETPVEIEARRQQSGLLERMVVRGAFSDNEVRATILGLATGFIPTNTLAAGNILEELLDNAPLYQEARRAARALAEARQTHEQAVAKAELHERAGDATAGAEARSIADKAAAEAEAEFAALETTLLKAAARYPALTPGIWRQVPNAATLDGGPGRRAIRFPENGLVLASINSALRDSRMPAEIASDPRKASDLIFGAYPHRCLGAHLAMAHIVEVFAALLARPGLRPVRSKHGTMWRAGPYPVRLDMQYQCLTAERCLMVSAIPVRAGVALETVKGALSALGNPVDDQFKAALDATGCIVFASLNVIEKGDGTDEAFLLVEVNGDGSEAHILWQLAEAGQFWLAPVLALCAPEASPPTTAQAMAQLMFDHVLKLRQRPWDTMGLHFDGLKDVSVADIARQAALARWARDEIDDRMRNPGLSDGRANDILIHLRRLLNGDVFYARRYKKKMAALGAERRRLLSRAIIRPSRKRLGLAGWKDRGVLATTITTMLSPDNRFILIALALLSAICAIPIYRLALPHGEVSVVQQGLALLAGLVAGPILGLMVAALGFGIFLLLVRSAEKREPSDPRIADIDHVTQILSREDAPGFEQNHIIAVMPLKRGLLRRFSFAFSMWWIRQAVIHWFRPGFVVTMGTIHKARWFVVPGTRQFVFHSNYDGSWESYLEDFITRAHEGQSSAWSHGEGFPPTRFLILDGASDGDRFKRWVRRQQRPSLCWYSRFPDLTAKQIRNNAMIEDGLARSASDTDARRWLANFGSAQREVDELESQEVQSIVFSGFGRHPLATALLVKFPDDAGKARAWLRDVIKPQGDHHTALASVRFGDLDFAGPSAVLGLTAAGLAGLGLREGMGLDQLPAAFRMGMHGRQRLLGDRPVGEWRWSDRDAAAVLILYTPDDDEAVCNAAVQAEHAALVAAHVAHLEAAGGAVVAEVPCPPLRDDCGRPELGREHFGFRDGISQPVIRGSRKAAVAPAPRDVVAPGEFLMGYRNDQGYVSPSVAVGAQHDPGARLPTVAEYDANRFPFFGNHSSDPDLRDFGRNCSFLVLRQLDQDVAGFEASLKRHASILSGTGDPDNPSDRHGYRQLSDMFSGKVTDEWVGAKIIGRWKDGSPLVGNPSCPAGLGPRDAADNDFAYGVDDPRGFACPLGAHIRRTNPRDSLEPGDAEEQAITNRHRILRRGRSYAYQPENEGKEAKGLLFAAICSDLERQFEFIQHTWINAKSFHGLTDEADPLLGNPLADEGKFFGQFKSAAMDEAMGGTNTRFTIPTAEGPVVIEGLDSYVTMRAGGYFMLPSRSALNFLARLS